MKKSIFLFLMIIAMVFSVACSTGTPVGYSLSIPSSSGGQVFFSLSAKEVANGKVEIDGNKQQARLGEKITLNVTPNEGYEVVWVKINDGNRAEGKLIYTAEDINSGKIENITVEYDMVIDAYFALPSEIVTTTPTYEGAPSNSLPAHKAYKIVRVTSLHGEIKTATAEDGTVTVSKNFIENGYKLDKIFVRNASTYEIIKISTEESFQFQMPESDVAIIAVFIPN